MVSWNQNQERADDVKGRQPQQKSLNHSEVGNMHKKPSRDNWWFFAWGLSIGAVLMGSILTLMNHFKG